MRLIHIACVSVLLTCASAVFGESPMATWINSTANTPDTAYNWDDAANWQNGLVASNDYDVTMNPSAGPVFIRVPAGRRIRKFTANNKVYLLDGPLEIASTGSNDANRGSLNVYNPYCDIAVPSDEKTMPYCSSVFYCGRLFNDSAVRMTLSSGSMGYRFDRFAREAGETREESIGHSGEGNGTISFYGPVGADAQQGTWRLTAGSPYAYRVSATAHPLAPGTLVRGTGLADGTFLKNVFTDAIIELSAPATVTGEATLDFAAFTPHFTATFEGTYTSQGSSGTFIVYKSRTNDEVRVVMPSYVSSFNGAKLVLGSTTTNILGTLAFGDVDPNSKALSVALRNVELELTGGTKGTTTFPAAMPFFMSNATETACIAVPASAAGVISSFSHHLGTVVKEGAGALTLGFDQAANAGTMVVSAGTLAIVKNAAAGADPLTLDRLELAAGTTLTLPPEGLSVKHFTAAPGTTVRGPGVLTVDASADFSGAVFTEGATLAVRAGEPGALVLTPPGAVSGPAGHPAFWVDASKPETLVYETIDGTNYMTRWKDCRPGETMFCTNLVLKPMYTNGATMAEKYVRLKNHNTSTETETDQLVWNVPLYHIKAIFLVHDPVDGGGHILGRSFSRLNNSYYGSQGGPFYRGTSINMTRTLVSTLYGTPCVYQGRFYLNGERFAATEKGYAQAGLCLIECHPNPDYAASAKSHDLAADAFGTGYMTGSESNYNFENGGMRIAEYVIYTNELTYAERLQTEQYLMNKWLGRDVPYRVAEAGSASDLGEVASHGFVCSVPAETGAYANQITGEGIEKTGSGTLFANALDVDALTVSEGAFLVNSLAQQYIVPPNPWLHVDAQDLSTLVTETSNGTNYVTRWNDCRKLGESLVNYKTARATYVADGLNGKPVVDLGENKSTANGAALRILKRDGTAWNSSAATMDSPLVKSGFFAYNSANGGGALFSGIGNAYPSKGFPHQHSQGADSPIVDEPTYSKNNSHGIPALSNACENGTAIFRRNGVQVNPCSVPYLGGPERVAFRYATGRRGDMLCCYGQSSQYYGGLAYGEVILYDRTLSDDEMARAEAYIAKKWFDIDTPGFCAARAGALTVAAGASMTVYGEPLVETTAGGGGSVTGDLVVSNGLVAVVNDAGAVGSLTVHGRVEIAAAAGEVTFAGAVDHLQPGDYTLLTADELAGGGTWSVTSPSRRYFCRVRQEGNAVVLTVALRGLTVSFR